MISTFERVVRLVLAILFVFVGLLVFRHPVAQGLAILFAAYALYEAISARCPLQDRIGEGKSGFLAHVAIQVVIGYIWLTSGFGKILGGNFIADLPKTLAQFADGNPYDWYVRWCLEPWVIPNTAAFGAVIQTTEAVAGIILIVGAVWVAYASKKVPTWASVVCGLSLLAVAGLNAEFYFAAGWMSPSTHAVNLVMFWVELALAYAWFSKAFDRK